MIPLKDNIKTVTFPIITVLLIFVNISSYLWLFIYSPLQERVEIYRTFGLVPFELFISITQRPHLLPYNIFTLFSSMFLHGSFLHLFGNMLYLWIFGNNVEDSMGHKRFVAFYLLSGLAASLSQFFYDPQSKIPMIGASGAVSGILGAYLVLFPYARVMTLLVIFIFLKVVEIPAVVFLTLWFFMQVMLSDVEGIAWFAHMGGFVFGMLTIPLFRKRVRRRRFT